MTYKIQGGGLSGLTAAINLARYGLPVEVHEKNDQIGGQIASNAQMLPNWFSSQDVIKELEDFNIEIEPEEEVNTAKINLNSSKIVVRGKNKPIGYTVIRGGEDSLEQNLLSQAQELGVDIKTSSQSQDPDIIATGPQEAEALIYGRIYSGNFDPETVNVFFSSKYTPNAYFYLYPHSTNRCSLVVTGLKRFDFKPRQTFENLIKQDGLISKLGLKRENQINDFAATANFNVPLSAKSDGSLLVGEAAGFQDRLTGFGMRFAIKSGYLAAKSILENQDYDWLWKKEFKTDLKKSDKLRDIYESTELSQIFSTTSTSQQDEQEKQKIELDLERVEQLWNSRWLRFFLKIDRFLPTSLRNFAIARKVKSL